MDPLRKRINTLEIENSKLRQKCESYARDYQELQLKYANVVKMVRKMQEQILETEREKEIAEIRQRKKESKKAQIPLHQSGRPAEKVRQTDVIKSREDITPERHDDEKLVEKWSPAAVSPDDPNIFRTKASSKPKIDNGVQKALPTKKPVRSSNIIKNGTQKLPQKPRQNPPS
jgi:hypothetical protein